jgi:UDP-N-acetylmuramoyl-L-alanyl-D-glutamate--2,6-diaminopimelate ligase
VFGAGGDRDAGKRAPMAAAAEQFADLLVLTSDNPRNEAPQAILAQLRAGLTREPYLVQEDRAAAIDAALQAAAAADVVLIAGKGHETYQEIGARRVPFSDVEHARTALRRRPAESGPAHGGATGDGNGNGGGAGV